MADAADLALVVDEGAPGAPARGAPARGAPLPARAYRQRTLLAGDLVAVLGAQCAGVAVDLARGSLRPAGHGARQILLVSLPPVCQLVVAVVSGQHRAGSRRLPPSGRGDAPSVLAAAVAGLLLASVATVVLVEEASWPRPDPMAVAASAACALVGTLAARAAVHLLWRLRRPVRVLIVGSGTVATQLRAHLEREAGACVVGFVDDDPAPPTPVLGQISELGALCRRLSVDRVLVAFSRTHPADLADTLREVHGIVPIAVVPRYFELTTWRSKVEDVSGLPVVAVAGPASGPLEGFAKRAFDIVVGGVLLVVLSPLVLALAALVVLTSPGPALVCELRAGREGRPFRMLGFRTRWRDADEVEARLCDGPTPAPPSLGHDPRLTPVGRWMRERGLDGLPRLVNVVLGHMSLVGPRPQPPEMARARYPARPYGGVRPGLAGPWCLAGPEHLDAEHLVRLDAQYFESWSLAWDLRILWQLPAAALRSRRGR